MATLSTLLGRLGSDQRVRGGQWERICAWFLTHDLAYRSQVHRVWLQSDSPGGWPTDFWPTDLRPARHPDLGAGGRSRALLPLLRHDPEGRLRA
jgi:hypothetical protein